MPTLETYKKQAKQFLHWHQSREWTVAAIIRDHVPRFAGFDDRAILDAEFKLADAQELVARRAGFADWAALKAQAAPGVEGEGDDDPMPFLRFAIPHVFVTDMDRALAYYTGVLGFRVTLKYGEPPFFAEVARDLARFCLRHVDEGVIDDAMRRKEDLFALTIGLENAAQVKALFEAFSAAGAAFHQQIKRHPWGARDFVVRDPDGNLISFGTGAGE